MKKLMLWCFICLISTPLFTQTSNNLVISGYVKYSEAPNLPVFQHTVKVEGPALNGALTTTTDLNGFYSFEIINGSVIGPNQVYEVFTRDCNNEVVFQLVSNQQGTVDHAERNFQICGWFGGCEAIFSYETTFLNPNVVHFNSNESIGESLTYFWDFGDGTTSTAQNPEHAYTSSGNYLVCLYINNQEGNCANTFCDTVQIGQFDGCQAFFEYSQPNINVPVINFNATGSTGNLNSYKWYKGGTLIGEGPQLSYTFDEAGTFQVCLKVTSSGGCFDEYCKSVIVSSNNNNDCNAFFVWEPSAPIIGQQVHFINQSTGANQYIWTINNQVVQGTVAGGLVKTFETAGHYIICLKAFGNNNCENEYCDTINVGGNTSSCNAAYTWSPTNIHVGQQVNFQNQSSGANSYIWKVNGQVKSTNENYEAIFETPGQYSVCLYINGTNCEDHQCQTITVSQSFCNPNFELQIFNSGFSAAPVVNNSNDFIFTWTLSTSAGVTQTFNNIYQLNKDNLAHGTYTLCLNVKAPGTTCDQTFCKTFQIQGSNNEDCDADFTYQGISNSGNSYKFIPIQTDNGTNHHWSFGNGYTSTQSTPIFEFQASGTYEVCHILTNSLLNCADTTCVSITINVNTNPCNATFSYNITSPSNSNTLTFTPNSANANTYEFIWYFGDGNNSTAYQPEHTYTQAGTYEVCLFLWNNANNCQAMECKTIVVGNPDSTNVISISGQVYAGNNFADFGYAYLIKYEEVSNSLNLIALAAVNNGNYIFNDVAPGQYFLKAALDNNSQYYANFLPTYFGSHLYWENALPVNITESGSNYVISLIYGSNPGGPGFVGGNVDDGANKMDVDAANPIAMADIILLDNNNIPQMWTKANYAGTYSMSNIAYGTYRIFADVPGLKCIPLEFTISPDFPSLEIEIVMGDGITFIIKNDLQTKVGMIYPNPASNNAFIDIKQQNPETLVLQIYDLSGRMLQSKSLGNRAEQLIQVETEKLATGIYTVVISKNKKTIANRKLVITRP